MRKYKEYTDEDVINNAKEVKSIAGLLKSLGLKPYGGNYGNIKRKKMLILLIGQDRRGIVENN